MSGAYRHLRVARPSVRGWDQLITQIGPFQCLVEQRGLYAVRGGHQQDVF
ncbi:hypothetical protein [Streptomyces sp. GbtcB6]|nr:hypothetical protein [Streptomyces sp. GbtcB6]